ncbi:MAG: hypothetical protein QOI11_773 [Candidatus Eremiobacteraeota bacterium]|nr:hypothetical protein [Candidatus Eremiobacteraeota bacterium]
MLRPLLRASAALAFAALLAPATPSAAPAPGLAYDEIVRVVINATPPPPGNFQADLAALSASPAPVAQATPAPKKRGLGGLAGIAGAVLSGGGAGSVAGAVAGAAISDAMANAVQQSLGAQFGALAGAMTAFLQPHLTRYAYYNGWERVDDVTAQTATIRKCDIGQVLHLDLARKTYTVYTPADEPTDAPAPVPAPRRGRQAPPDPAQPGTATVTLSEATRALGSLRIENQATAGFDSTTTFAMSNATGSCRDGSASVETVQYLSGLHQPAVTACPIRRRAVPDSATGFVAPPSGGCRPTFAASRSGPTPPTGRLALYSLFRLSAGAGATPAPAPSGGPGGFAFLTERGNLKTLGAADAGLFGVPPGFTKAP